MSAYSTKLAEAFSAKVLKELYARSVFDDLVNRDYEGDISQAGSVCNILSFAKLQEKDYNGSNLAPDDLNESNAQLTITKQKSFYFKVRTIDKFKSYIKNPESIVKEQTFLERKKNVDAFVLGYYAKAAAGQWIGTNYTTGTVTVDASGNVTGSGTTFTSSMVGKPFQATGQTAWYRIATFVSTTSITIQDDLDDVASQYTGGAIAGGTAYTIQANTPVAITGSNIKSKLIAIKTMFDNAEVPEDQRMVFLPPTISQWILQATDIVLNVPAAYENLVVKGFITELLGMKIFETPRVQGDNTNGYHIIGAQKNWLTFADKILEADVEEQLIGNFGAAYKDLYVYGAKVADNRRKFGVHMLATG
jgi:hypothetical protein